jgi:HPt (histidine-containing phosphotransfer) domain-containing protein
MVALENIKHRLKNVPGYIKAKVKGKPFHWTMTRKQAENRTKSFQTIHNRSRKQRSENRRDSICAQLEALGATNMPKYKNTYKEFCLTAENANVGEVNLNILDQTLESESLNLPLKENPIQVANSLLDEATTVLDSLNEQMTRLPLQVRPISERVKQIKVLQPMILADIGRGKEIAAQAKAKAQTVLEKPNAPRIVAQADEIVGALDSIAQEVAAMTVYSIQNARQNLRSGIRALGANNDRNLSNAYRALRGSSSTSNLSLLAEYATALEEYQGRIHRERRNRNRATRVAAMKMGPPGTVGKRYGYGGKRTRKQSK